MPILLYIAKYDWTNFWIVQMIQRNQKVGLKCPQMTTNATALNNCFPIHVVIGFINGLSLLLKMDTYCKLGLLWIFYND